jgi:hypothetical protein
MDLIKKYKIGILITVAIIAGTYHLYSDDELNPKASKWIEYYSIPTDLNENAFIGLIALSPSNDISTSHAIGIYEKKLGEISKGSLDYFQQLKYPDIKGLPEVYEEDYFCEFNKGNCLVETVKNRDFLEKFTVEFSSVTKQYRELSKLSNFASLNSIATEPNWDSLVPIQRLAALEVYFHILDNELELAVEQLSQLISLDRKFLRTASEAVFHAIPIVNYELYYQPLIIKLKQKGFSDLGIFKEALSPLTNDDISMNRMWLMMFAQGTRSLQLKYLADRAEDLGYSLYGFQAQLKYKENMTLNSMFDYYSLQLMPDNAKKKNLVAWINASSDLADKHSEQARKDMDNSIWFTIKNYRNIVGAYLEVTALPKILNLYDEKFKLDLRLLLLNIITQENKDSLAENLYLEEYRNPYTGEFPKLSNSELCYTLQDDNICISIF